MELSSNTLIAGNNLLKGFVINLWPSLYINIRHNVKLHPFLVGKKRYMDWIYTTAAGYIAGIIILFVLGRVLTKPMKYIIKLLYCTIIGGVVLLLINFVGDKIYFHIPFNILTSIIVGLLGIPGVALLVVLKILFNT